MPHAIVIEAASSEPVSRTALHGARLQGAFLDLVRRADSELAKSLHDGDVLRGYSLAWMPERRGQPGPTVSSVGLRAACLDDRIYPALSRLVTGESGNAAIFLGTSEFRIVSMRTVGGPDGSWSGYRDWPVLLERAWNAAPSKTVGLEFASPVYFRQGHRDDPMPNPEYVFGSLARRWNAAAGTEIAVPEGFVALVREHVVVSHLQGRTVDADVGDGRRQTGFTGRVAYRVLKDVPVEGSPHSLGFWCRLMAEAAFFSGLGAKTSRGFGLARKLRG